MEDLTMIKRQYIDINEVIESYLPMSKKKARKFVIRYLDHKWIGNKIYVDRIKLEELLKSEDVESFLLDYAKTPSVTKADGAAFFSEQERENQCRHFQIAVFPYISLRFWYLKVTAILRKVCFHWFGEACCSDGKQHLTNIFHQVILGFTGIIAFFMS